MFLRNELSKQYKLLSNYPKVGFAKNLIMDGKVYKELCIYMRIRFHIFLGKIILRFHIKEIALFF